jgi:ABC-type transport system involved in cytochrome c biogenesis permease subunit
MDDQVKRYAYGSCAVGLLEIVGAITIQNHQPHPQPITAGVCGIELLWIPLSLAALPLFRRGKISAWSPISYLVFKCLSLLSFIAWGISIAQQDPNKIIEVQSFPSWMILANLFFGFYFLGLNICLCQKLVRMRHDTPA